MDSADGWFSNCGGCAIIRGELKSEAETNALLKEKIVKLKEKIVKLRLLHAEGLRIHFMLEQQKDALLEQHVDNFKRLTLEERDPSDEATIKLQQE